MNVRRIEAKLRAAVRFAKKRRWRIVKRVTFVATLRSTCMCPMTALVLYAEATEKSRKSFLEDLFRGRNFLRIRENAQKILGVSDEAIGAFMEGFDGRPYPHGTEPVSTSVETLWHLGRDLRLEMKPKAWEYSS